MYQQKKMMQDIEQQLYGHFNLGYEGLNAQLGAQKISGLSEQLQNQDKRPSRK